MKKPTCKVCGAPRWIQSNRHNLCEAHFLEYMRIKGREYYRRKMAKLGREVVPHRQWAAQTTIEFERKRAS